MALATSFVTFAMPNVLSRIGGSPQHPVGNGLLAEQFPPARRGFAISAHIAGGNVGTVLILAVVGTPVLAQVGWRGVSLVLGVCAVADRARHPGLRPRAAARTGLPPWPAAAAATRCAGSWPIVTCAGCS